MLKRKVCRTLALMSLVVSSMMPVEAAGSGELVNLQNNTQAVSVIDSAPPVPNVTKFWMSGWSAYWYRMETNLQIGTCIYSIDPDPCTTDNRNMEYEENHPDKFKIKEIPDKFLGCDYVITRKGDAKGIHFQAEQKIDVYVAIDDDNSDVPTSHNGFSKTGDIVKLDNGNTYFLAKKTYDAGKIVQIAGVDYKNNKYKGDNVFYLILPAEGETISNVLTENPLVEEGKKPERNAADEKYQYYLNDVFNEYSTLSVPDGYTGKNVIPSGEPTTTEEKRYQSGDNMALDCPYTYNSKGYEGSPVDGQESTYWESEGLPGKLTINLEAVCRINKITLKLRERWGDRTQKLSIETSTDGLNFETIAEAKDYDFKKDNKNAVDISFDETAAQYVRVTGTANSEQADTQISEIEIYGPTQDVTLVHVDPEKNRYGILNNGGELTKTFENALTGKIVYEGKVRSSSNNEEMSIPVMKSEDGRTAVDLKFTGDGHIKAGDTIVTTYEKDTWYTIKMLIDIDNGTYEVWVNHIRKVQSVRFNEDVNNIKSMTFSNTSGNLDIDNLRLYDNTEVFIVDSNFNQEKTGAIPSGWTYVNERNVSVEEVPFAEDKSMLLTEKGTSAVATFEPVTGDVTVEAKVKPMESSWATVPIVKDSKGNVAVKIAMYRNSFFACNGDNWEYICNQEIPNNYYPAENWYQVKVVLNTYTNRYDLYIDGAKRCGDLSFATDVEDIASIAYTVEEDNRLYVDNVKVFDSASLARGLYPSENVFNVKDFGAAGDGKTDDTKAIAKAIEAAQYTGGTVLLENGVFYCGQIDMLSDMTLFIDTSAEILAKMDRNEYVQFIASKGYNAHHQLGKGIIRSVNADNFRITGGGVLNGNGLYAWDENDPTDSRRPCAMYLTLSNDVYVDNINIVSSPFWTLVPFESTNLTMRNIAITNNIAPNRDGIDPTTSSNMTIENCYIIAGDDALCPKNGNDIESANCDVRNVFMQSYCNGIKFGTDSYGAFKNYNMEDIWMKCVGLSGITIQSVDGSEIDNLHFKRIDMNDVDNVFAFMVGNRKRTYSGGGDGAKKHGYIKNIVVEDLNYTNPMLSPYSHSGEDLHEAMIVGLDPEAAETIQDGNEKTHRISNVLFKNVYMEMPGGDKKIPNQPEGILDDYPEHAGMSADDASVGWAYTMRWADNVLFENCTNVLLKEDVRKEYSYDEYSANPLEPSNVSISAEQIPYGIVFEPDDETMKAPAISGVIGAGSKVTVLTDNLLSVLEDDYDLQLKRDVYENAILKCESDGSLKLMDCTNTVILAEAQTESFLNEDDKRLVFHITNRVIDIPEQYYVTFDMGGNKQSVRVQSGQKVSAIAEPGVSGMIFTGWYLDGELFDFDTVITGDIILTAGFEDDESSNDTSSGNNKTPDNPSDNDSLDDDATPDNPSDNNSSDDGATPDNPSDNDSSDDGAKPENPSDNDSSDDSAKPENPSDNNSSDDGAKPDNPSDNDSSDDGAKPDNPSDNDSSDDGTTSEDSSNDNSSVDNSGKEDSSSENSSENDKNPGNPSENDTTNRPSNGNVSNDIANNQTNGDTTGNSSGANVSTDNPTQDGAVSDNSTNGNASTNDSTAGNSSMNLSSNGDVTNSASQGTGGTKENIGSAVMSQEESNIAELLDVTPEEAKQINQIAKQYNVSQNTLAVTDFYVKSLTNDSDVKGSAFGVLQAKAKKQTKKTVKLSWNTVNGAEGYLVYGAKCGKGNSYKLLSTITNRNKTSFTQENLKTGTYYKYLVCAYRNVGNMKVTLAASKTIHVVTSGGKYVNVKKVNVDSSKVNLLAGESIKLTAKEVKIGVKSKKHRKLSYESSDTSVATVSKSGRINAKKNGRCYVYVYAQNGVFKRVCVTVK